VRDSRRTQRNLLCPSGSRKALCRPGAQPPEQRLGGGASRCVSPSKADAPVRHLWAKMRSTTSERPHGVPGTQYSSRRALRPRFREHYTNQALRNGFRPLCLQESRGAVPGCCVRCRPLAARVSRRLLGLYHKKGPHAHPMHTPCIPHARPSPTGAVTVADTARRPCPGPPVFPLGRGRTHSGMRVPNYQND